MARHKPTEERFWPRVNKAAGCWEWTGSKSRGYGQIGHLGMTIPAHRYSYESAYGPIPAGFEIDHICRNLGCVNPEHLRAVTHKQNCENRNQAGWSSSGVRGIDWNRRQSKWRARVADSGKSTFVGYFVSLEDAKAAVIAKRLELHQFNDADRR